MTTTFVDLLQERAAQQPAQRAYTFLLDGESNEAPLTYAELDRQARRIAGALQQHAAPDDRVLLLYPPGLEYIAAFFGCLYAGMIAIPAYPPNPARLDRTLPRLQGIIQDSQPALALTTAMIKPLGEAAFAQDPAGTGLRWLATDTLTAGLEQTWRRPELDSETIAFLQYTSGSTSAPKGVIVSHANLLHNSAQILRCFGVSRESSGVIWLPPYHDMGLIGGILQPLYGGAPAVLMSPVDFLQRPFRWLQAISRYRATTSGGPNFAYDLCVRKITAEQRATLDLSSWELAFNGAEPIHPATMRRFSEAFAPCGFRSTAFSPCYGLAEATLIVSGGAQGPALRAFEGAQLADHRVVASRPDDPDGRELVGCGVPLPDQQLLIVQPETRSACPPDQVGEIWLAGPSVARGYWGQAAETTATFRARLSGDELRKGGVGEAPIEKSSHVPNDAGTLYLRTGDLGFLHDGQLFITGRLKDVIIIRGRNYYPQDIERAAEQAHAALRPGCGAAFALPGEGAERLVIVQELERTYREPDTTLITQAIRQAVAEEQGVQPDQVILILHGSIPKTSSGKIQRYACREALLAGRLNVLAQSSFAPDSDLPGAPELTREAILAAPAAARPALMENFLLRQLGTLIGHAPEKLSPGHQLSRLGLDSMIAIEAQHAIEANFGVALSPTVFLDDTTLGQLAQQLLAALTESGIHEATPRYANKDTNLRVPSRTFADNEDTNLRVPSRSFADNEDTNLRVPSRTFADREPLDELSYGQRALWFLQQLAPANTAYTIARAARIRAQVDVPALGRALRSLVERHAMLRTTFPNEHGVPRQRIGAATAISLRHERVAGLSDAALHERLSAEAHRPFDIERDAPLRLYLFTRSAQEHVLLLVAHHIVLDFWSLAVLLQELGALYAQEHTGLERQSRIRETTRNHANKDTNLRVPSRSFADREQYLTDALGAARAPQPAQYDDYVRRQREMLAGPEGTRLWTYWRQQLAGDLPFLDLPADDARPPVQTYDGAEQFRTLPAPLLGQLKQLSRARGTTLYMTLLAAWQVWLSRVTGQQDVLVGSLTTGRPSAETAQVVGYFVNPIVLRGDLRGDPPFVAFLEQVRQTVLAALAHQQFPFALLTERLQPNRDPSRPPLFQVLFTMQQAPFGNDLALAPFSLNQPDGRLELGGLGCESLPIAQHTAQFDLALAAAETSAGLGLTVQYNRDLFAPATIAGFLDQYQVLLEGIAADPDRHISALPLLDAHERQRILVDWNATDARFPAPQPLHELIAAQAERTPDAVAVVFDHQEPRTKNQEPEDTPAGGSRFSVLGSGDGSQFSYMTYAELNRRANQLAHVLRARGVGPDVLVGLCVERSLELVIGLLGILKAGGAYVPLDPTYPAERIRYVLEDAQVAVLLTSREIGDWRLEIDAAQQSPISNLQSQIIYLDADWDDIAQHPDTNPAAAAGPEHLAYVIYTSGSTGRPKGVAITHGAVVNFLRSMRQEPGLTSADRLLAVTTLSFDIAALEIWLPLVVGARVVLASRAASIDGAQLAALIAASGATALQATPATWRLLLECGWPGDPRLTILCGGEALPRELAEQLLPRSAALWNMYGPTETTIWSAVARVRAEQPGVPIGRPIAHTQLYILNPHMQPVPVGVAGELYIGGAGLARGYLNRPELTAERFVPNPFAERGGEGESGRGGESENFPSPPLLFSPSPPLPFVGRLYKTGDLCRYRADGQVEYLGRADQQVKLRGFRIELGEIEAVLADHAAVRQAVVVAREGAGGERRLVAYIVSGDWRLEIRDSSGDNLQSPISNLPQELRAFLKQRLPDYMIPAAFVVLHALPLTPNGKIDRRALPAPEAHAPGQQAAPQSHTERSIAAIWREVLQLDHVGLDDNFFDLGGHSLLVAQVHSRLREQLGVELSMVDLFKYPTIGALAAWVRQGSQAPHAAQPVRKRRAPTEQRDADIAIVGMAGRFPGAPDVETYWDNLRDGVESIVFFTDQELLDAGVNPALLGDPNYVKARAALPDIDLFDAAFFGLPPREAESMDPQHRVFLECAWHALEHTGYDPARYQGRVGLYAGAAMNTYILNVDRARLASLGTYQAFIGNDKDFIPTRVSYKLNLRGPSVNVQTACSSSLVATHLACQSLLNGECDMAMAGGVTISVPQTAGYLYEPGGIPSPDGHCRAFDAAAQGTVLGSGVGIVVLKRLADALNDGDTIHALIKGSAINNDGATKIGYTAPSVTGQAEVIAQALAVAGVEPETIQYIETHGTGTALGDPIEIAALTQAFRTGTDKTGFCRIGSVKTNIGHLDAAAGIAGLIKTVLALSHAQIPPSLHFQQPNPQIDFANSPCYVNASLTEWPARDIPRRAGVSSFGIGGTNAHVILEEAPLRMEDGGWRMEIGDQSPVVGRRSSVVGRRPWHLLLLSAKTESALEATTDRLIDALRRQPEQNLADIAYTLQVGRATFGQRRMVLCQGHADAIAALESRDPQRVVTAAQERHDRPVAFMFPGVGDQYVNMAQGLYQGEPIFREQIDRCAEILKPHLQIDLRDILFPNRRGGEGERGRGREEENGQSPISNLQSPISSADHSDPLRRALRGRLPQGSTVGGETSQSPISNLQSPLNQTQYAHPILFAVEYALAKLWMAWGLHPQALIGYSLGEYVAACLAGVFTLEDGLRLVVGRARMIHELPAGAMLAVLLPEQELRPLLGADLSLAAVNGPAMCVAAGPLEAIGALEQHLAAQTVACRRVQTTHALHSTMMEPISAALVALVETIELKPPSIPYLSNVSGTWITAAEATDPRYWARHMCQSVRFADGLAELWRNPDAGKGDPFQVLLEVGPGQTLSTLALGAPAPDAANQRVALPSLRYGYDRQPDQAFLLQTLGRLWLAGVPIDWAGLHGAAEQRRRVPLPGYPFERRRHWLDAHQPTPLPPASLDKQPDIADWFYVPLWKQSVPLRPLAPKAPADQPERWLILSDACGLGTRLAQRLEQAGQAVILVTIGDRFSKQAPQRYRINPRRADDYGALIDELRAADTHPTHIVHLWQVTTSDRRAPGFAAVEQAQNLGFNSLLFLVQALGKREGTESLQLALVSNDMQPVAGETACTPEKATILGPCKVIPQEYPYITCRSIDIQLPESDAGLEALTDQLLAEMSTPSPDSVIAYRGAHRWVQTFEPVRVDHHAGQPARLREGGVYLITGGLGGLGLLFAEELARTTHARLVLLSRTALPARDQWEHWLLTHDAQDDTSRKIRSVQALEAQGAEVLVCSADVTDQEQMRAVVAAANQRFGAIHGVIHAAGLAGGGIIQFKTPEIADTVLAPKVKGTLVLYDLFKDVQLDFFVLCSSINAIVGGFGQVDYCAANAFLDTFAAHIRFGSNPFVTSVNWDRWQGVGMALDTNEQVMGLGALLNGMAPQEGIDVFRRILGTSPLSQIIISSKHLPSVMDYARLFMAAYAENMAQIGSQPGTHTRPTLKTAYVAPTSDLERAIADIWQKVLGIEQVGIYDSFLDLGGNSLVAIQLTAQLRATFDLDLSLSKLFEAATVAGLAQLVADAQIELDEQETLEILQRLEQLSEAEIEQEIKGKLYAQGSPLDP